jgi:hypothetical protein
LREFLQKNFQVLPIQSMGEIEDIISLQAHPDGSTPKNESSLVPTNRTPSVRRMADTYKKIRDMASKYGQGEPDVDQMISEFKQT